MGVWEIPTAVSLVFIQVATERRCQFLAWGSREAAAVPGSALGSLLHCPEKLRAVSSSISFSGCMCCVVSVLGLLYSAFWELPDASPLQGLGFLQHEPSLGKHSLSKWCLGCLGDSGDTWAGS